MSAAQLFRHLPDFSIPAPVKAAVKPPVVETMIETAVMELAQPPAEPKPDIEASRREAFQEGLSTGRREAADRLIGAHKAAMEQQAREIRAEEAEKRKAEQAAIQSAFAQTLAAFRQELDDALATLLGPVTEQLLQAAALVEMRQSVERFVETGMEIDICGPLQLADELARQVGEIGIHANVTEGPGPDLEVKIGSTALRTRLGTILQQFSSEVRGQ